MAKTILVLGDGETWDIPENCAILTVTDEAYEQIEGGTLKARNLGRFQIIKETMIEEIANESEEQ